jgi:hypothetical protein
LVRKGGYSSLIVPNKLLGAEYSISVQSLIKASRPIAFRDYSRAKVFEQDVYPIVYLVQAAKGIESDTITLSTAVEANAEQPRITGVTQIKLKVLNALPEGYWWPMFSGNVHLIAKAIDVSKPLTEFATVVGGASVSESYKLKELLTSLDTASLPDDYFVFINTGTIDRYDSLWATNPTSISSKPIKNQSSRERLCLKKCLQGITKLEWPN